MPLLSLTVDRVTGFERIGNDAVAISSETKQLMKDCGVQVESGSNVEVVRFRRTSGLGGSYEPQISAAFNAMYLGIARPVFRPLRYAWYGLATNYEPVCGTMERFEGQFHARLPLPFLTRWGSMFLAVQPALSGKRGRPGGGTNPLVYLEWK